MPQLDLDALQPQLPVERAKRPDRPVQQANPAVYGSSQIRRGTPFNVEFIKRTDGTRRQMLAVFQSLAKFRGRRRRGWAAQDYGLWNVLDLRKGAPRMIPHQQHPGDQLRRQADPPDAGCSPA